MPRLPLLLACLALTGCSPQPVTKWVTDGAHILDADMEKRLSARLASAERKFGPQLVVVTTKSLQGQPIEEYSLKLAIASKVGDGARNDGLLLLVAPNERKTRIEVGTGLEATFSDAYAKSVIDQTLVPNFREGRFQSGIDAAVDRLINKMREVRSKAANDNMSPAAQKDAV